VSGVSEPAHGDAASESAWFEVSLIPETLTATTLGARVIGDRVNIETDILARQVERMLSLGAHAPEPAPDANDTARNDQHRAEQHYARSDA
jgi:riboflavin synthase